MKEYIYIICPVRNITKEQEKEIAHYVMEMELEGHTVHFPQRDVDQNDPTGTTICSLHAQAMTAATRVDVFWDRTSSGSHFDLGMAYILRKRIKIVKLYQPDSEGKSYVKVMQSIGG